MPKLILVCGTSFSGKSTLARHIACRFGFVEVGTITPRPQPSLLKEAHSLGRRPIGNPIANRGFDLINTAEASCGGCEGFILREILTLDHRHFEVLRPLSRGSFRLIP